ncbi:NADase-type glycan-binding domain-containing protein [Nocardioides donggukensis]|uniref:Zinc ribbon domain-containing protein n=1 Tax=Nocardioides donggukensis TaxID=2774019 RepID=A0A927K7E6_9ACTN|nr:zinc ribbon domain-containing protein [Nocardioides donggukensis]MBD8869186.1 zinc ribbon domain-containing protein [Nocardioides donggukensis]
MNFCASCGARLGTGRTGRFCTRCGAPVPGASPATSAGAPPAADPGSTSRYPLFADEVVEPADWAPPPAAGESRTARRPVLWLGALVLALLTAVATGVWLTSDDDETPVAATGAEDPGGSDGPDPSPSEPPRADDVSGTARVSGPRPLPPGRDLAGRRVGYALANMVDGDPATAFRTAGDASGKPLTFTLPEPAVIREVGLINGYAKSDSARGRTVDWYPLNRRITRVQWIFDDGSTVTQDLRMGTDLQTVAVEGVRTRSVGLRILTVSPPGTGPLRKNVTAISEVLLRASS